MAQRQKDHQAAGDKETERAFGARNAANIDAQQTREEGQRQEHAGDHGKTVHDAVHPLCKALILSFEYQADALAQQFELFEIARQTVVQFVPVVVVILDEPQNGLDPDGIIQLRTMIRSLAAEGRTVLVSSHQLAEVTQFADDVGILANGALVFEATTGSLTDNLEAVYLDAVQRGVA